MGAAALQKRREQLDAYMKELSGSFLPENLFAVLCDFVELKQQLAKSSASAAPVRETPPQEPTSIPVAPKWDESFLTSDPLAALLTPDEPPAVPPVTAPTPAAKKNPPPAAASSAAAAGPPIPGLFGVAAAKSYAASGEGLRDAIKAGDVAGVKAVLTAAPDSAIYQDRLSQSMLHLAAIFNHTEIADLLLAAGADPAVVNSDKETPMDVAQPTLKRKMQLVPFSFLFPHQLCIHNVE